MSRKAQKGEQVHGTEHRALRSGRPMYTTVGSKMRCQLCDKVIAATAAARGRHESGREHRLNVEREGASGACPYCGLPYDGGPCLCMNRFLESPFAVTGF